MPRYSSRNAILDAAEAVVIESGASHMTLDAVAERTGISKGGLIYNFSSKEALLEAMLTRMEDRFSRLREKIRQELRLDHPNELVVELRSLRAATAIDHGPNAALLAVVANQPKLAKNLREELRDRFREITSNENFTRSSIIFFAALGVHYHDLLNISFLNHQQRKAIFNELLRLAYAEEDF